MASGKSIAAKIFLIILLIIPEIVCKRAGAEICEFIELGIAILFAMLYLTDKPGTYETRRRVIFQDTINGGERPGGVTINGLEAYFKDTIRENKDITIYSYDSSKFGSTGIYINYQFNMTQLKEQIDPDFDFTYNANYASFIHAGWKSDSLVSTKVQVKGRFDGTKDVTDYLSGLKIIIDDDTASINLDLKIKEVSDRPNSWVLRLIFYLLVFVALCVWCCKGKGSLEKSVEGNDSISYCYQAMNILLSMAAIKMTFLYYFIGVFWFWSLAIIVDLIIICIIWDGLKGSLSHITTRLYLIVGGFFTTVVLFFLGELFPFLVLYTYAGIHYDMAINKLKISKRNRIQFFSASLYQSFTFFAFYNNANPKYYKISIPSMSVFTIIGVTLHILSFLYFEKDPRDVCNFFDPVLNRGVKISKRNNNRIKKYVQNVEKDFSLNSWQHDHEGVNSNKIRINESGFGPGSLMRSISPTNNIVIGDYGVESGV